MQLLFDSILLQFAIVLDFEFYFSMYAELLDRQQKRMSLVLIPVDFFVPVRQFSDEDMEEDVFGRNIPPLSVLYEESSEIWVNVSIRQIKKGGPCLLNAEMMWFGRLQLIGPFWKSFKKHLDQ